MAKLQDEVLNTLFRILTYTLVMEEVHNDSFTTQLINKIVDNVQIHIKNIHFRYEDNLSHPNHDLFSFGFTLESLSAVSTNGNWEVIVTEIVDRIYKLVNLEDRTKKLNKLRRSKY